MITHALTIPITQCEQPGQQLIIKKGVYGTVYLAKNSKDNKNYAAISL